MRTQRQPRRPDAVRGAADGEGVADNTLASRSIKNIRPTARMGLDFAHEVIS